MAEQTATEANPVEVVSNLTDTVNKHFTESKQQNEKLAEKYTANAEKIDKLTDRIELAEKNAAMPSVGKSNTNILCSQEVKYNEEFNTYLTNFNAPPSHQTHSEYLKKLKLSNPWMNAINPNGGYLVKHDISYEIQKRVYDFSDMRSVAKIVNTNGTDHTFTYSDVPGTTGGYTGEGVTFAITSNPKLGTHTIPIHKIYALPQTTTESISDSHINVQEFLIDEASTEIIAAENRNFLSGDGVLKPRGFLTYEPWTVNTTVDLSTQGIYESKKLETITMGQAGSITIDDLIAPMVALRKDYRPGAIWIMNRFTWGIIQKISTTTQYPLISDTFLRNGVQQEVLLGKPVAIMDDMPNLATGEIPIAYGNFKKGYTIVDRSGMSLIINRLRDYAYVEFAIESRNGGDVSQWQAIKLLKGA